LEERRLLATFQVLNTSDSGAGSLRQAILDANSSPNVAGPDVIAFFIQGSGVQTISPVSALPTITDPVIIDGTSQPGFAGTPLIELDGTNAGGSGLMIDAGGSTVKVLIINRFSGDGIVLENSGGDTIVGNYIGTDATGTLAQGNAFNGIGVFSDNNTIGGTTNADRNVISGNGNMPASSRNGIEIHGSGNLVQGNFIGVDVTGAHALGNLRSGVVLFSSSNTVGGTVAGAANVLAANTESGVYIQQLTG